MTKYLLTTLLALTGCVIVNTQRPAEEPPAAPRPTLPKLSVSHRQPAALSPKAITVSTAKPMRLLAAPLVPVIPTWVFTNVVGTYQIEASTNLSSWWPVAVVYSVTNVTLTSRTVNKRPMLFYRLTAIP